MDSESWEELLLEVKVSDLVQEKNKKLIWMDKQTSLKQALEVRVKAECLILEVLATNHILSAPVVNSQLGNVIGFIDVLDIAGYVLDAWNKHSASLTSEFWKERSSAKFQVFETEIGDLENFCKVDQAIGISEDKSLAELLALFCDPRGYSRIHRIAVTDKRGGQIKNVVTQSDVIAFAANSISILPKRLLERTVRELGLLHPIITSRLDCTFYESLEKLYKNRVSGIALCDENGRLAANFSASDLRGISPNSFNDFTKSTVKFLTKSTTETLLPPVSCTEDTLASDVIQILFSERVHRCYVTTQGGIPIGVITLGDIVKLLAFQPSQ